MMPEPEVIVGFADGLHKLKIRADLNRGAVLTAEEVHGLLWGIKQLRGGPDDGSADPART
jgi:hypothetical protein